MLLKTSTETDQYSILSLESIAFNNVEIIAIFDEKRNAFSLFRIESKKAKWMFDVKCEKTIRSLKMEVIDEEQFVVIVTHEEDSMKN